MLFRNFLGKFLNFLNFDFCTLHFDFTIMPKLSISPKQIAIIGGGLIVVVVLFLVLSGGSQTANQLPAVNLLVWGFEDQNFFEDNFVAQYTAISPNVTIDYVQVGRENYNDNLLNALAAGRGPDIFPVGNRNLPKEIDKLGPAPFDKFNLVSLRDLFPSVVEYDFTASSGQVYALPSYLDTLVLFYNKDLFDQASIVSPPKTWEEFLSDVSRLRVINEGGQIVRAAAAVGGTEKTVDAGVDLLNLLMLQNGVLMTDEASGQAAFASEAGLAAFNFYLQFGDAASPYFTWNDSQPNSLTSFAEGKTAMIFNYRSAIAELKAKNPFLNFGVALVPQVSGGKNVSYPRYDGWAVSKQSKWSNWAWDFIVYLTTSADATNAYILGLLRPPALRSLIDANLQDVDFGVFAKQALIARSWHAADDQKIRAIMNSALETVILGRTTPEKSLEQAENQISVLMKQQSQ